MRKGRYHSHKCVSLLCDPCSFSGAVPPETAPLTGCSPHSGKRRCNPTPSHVPSGGITNGVCAIKQVTARPPTSPSFAGCSFFCPVLFDLLPIHSQRTPRLPALEVGTENPAETPGSQIQNQLKSQLWVPHTLSIFCILEALPS